MRKLLLLAAVLFSLSGMAQNKWAKLGANLEKVQLAHQGMTFHKLPTDGAKQGVAKVEGRAAKAAAATALADIPSTATKVGGFYEGYENVYGVGFCIRLAECEYYINGDTVYLPVLTYASYSDKTFYLKGALDKSAGVVTVEPGQVVVESAANDLQVVAYKCNDEDGSAETSTSITFTYDSEDGSIYGDDYTMIGFYLASDLTSDGLANICMSMAYGSDSDMPAVETWAYSYKDTEGYAQNSTIKMMSEEGVFIMNGLMPQYTGNWIMGANYDETNTDIYIPSSQVLADDVALYAGVLSGSQVSTSNFMILYNNAADNTYSSVGDSVIFDAFANDESTVVFSQICSDIVLTAPSAGISNAKTDKGEGKAVQTQYYDLLGRRVNGEQKGVCIKQTRYADGTSKAVKVVK